jgi:hypothetical protein
VVQGEQPLASTSALVNIAKFNSEKDEVTRFERVKRAATVTVVTLVIAALSFAVAQTLFGTKAQALTSGDFTIQGTITATYPSCSGSSGALLNPGSTRCITYTVTDNLQVPITVQSITTSFDPNKTQPSNCSVSNLNLGEATFSGSIIVSPGTSKSTSEPIGMYDGSGGVTSHTNQDGCKGATFNFLYSGTGTYIEVYGTSTSLASSSNPSNINQTVTYTATVTGIVGSGQDPLPNGPTGTVTFRDNGNPISGCTNVAAISTTSTTSKFACVVTYSSTTGVPHPITAVFTDGTDANFANGVSGVLLQTVNFSVPCIGTVNGGYTVASGKSICISGRVNGGITVRAGGVLDLQGATVNGGVISTGATALRFCASTINGGVTATGTTGFVMIGDKGDDGTPTCAANTTNGGLTLTNNRGGLEISGNTISGAVTLIGNTGSGPTTEDAVPEVEGNRITGTLSCATSNSPVLSNGGYHNTVTGTKSGECSGTGF